MYPLFSPLGDLAVRISFGDRLDEKINDTVMQSYRNLKEANLEFVSEMVPGFVTLTVYYNPSKVSSYKTVISELKNCVSRSYAKSKEIIKKRYFTLPVLYGMEKGPDLSEVADYHGISSETLIQRHSSVLYRVYMMGFAPGFPYLGGMDESIATPRRRTPRQHVPSGSVGIAGAQTGIYSIDSPGGWQIIGHTPVRLFDISRDTPVLLKSNDYLQFKPVSEAEYHYIFAECEKGIYEPHIEWK